MSPLTLEFAILFLKVPSNIDFNVVRRSLLDLMTSVIVDVNKKMLT